MDFSLTEELQLLKQSVRDFVENEVEPVATKIEEEGDIPEILIKKAKGMGLFGLSIPSEYDGAGIGMVGKCVAYEQLGRSSNAFMTLIGAHTGIGSVGLVDIGNEYQKKKYLPPMARGEWIGAFALTEPSAGSDASSLKTTAVKCGDKYILNGSKHFITNAPIANVFTVMAVTDKQKGAKGITSFIVEKNFPGFRVGKIEKKMGLHGSHTAELLFEECEVPKENVLGEEGQGYVNALKILANGRAGLAIRNLGSSQKLLELCIDYAKQRIQFNKPIIENQVIQHMLADMAIEIEVGKSMAYRVAWMVDQDMKCIKEASIIKAFASEVYNRIADKAVQIHGGMGYMQELSIERFYRDARIAKIYEGTSEIQRNVIANELLKEFA